MIKDYYKLKIKGRDFKRFINTLVSFKIYFDYSSIRENECIIIVDSDNYEKIKKLKTSYDIEVINTYGPVKYKRLLKKYSLFLGSIFLAFLLLTFLSSLIFRVEVLHSNKEIRDLVRHDLYKYNIRPYRFKKSFKEREEIIDEILTKEKDKLEWLEIKTSGTTYIVNVEERLKNKDKVIEGAQDIVAKKDAMILRIEASHGEVQKKKYDYVKRGDVIISGFIKNKEDYVSKVRAEGVVFGEVWYDVRVVIPKVYDEVKYTNNEKYVLQFKYLDKDYNLFSNYKDYESDNKFVIKNNILPISFGIVKLREVLKTYHKYNINNVDNKALELSLERLSSQLGDRDRIISKKVLKRYEKKGKIVVDVFFKVSEDITDYVSIKDKEIPKNTEEE